MAKNQKYSSFMNPWENTPSISELISDPEFIKGYAKGEAIAQTIKQTPMQPEITAEAIQPEPQFVKPSSNRYVPVSGETPELSVYDQMLAATGDKEQKNLLYKLLSQSMQQQEEGVKQAEEALRKEQERQSGLSSIQKLDLRPFAEAIRAYGATSVAPGVVPEMTELQRQEVLRKLQGQLQAAQQGLTKEQVAALRQMRGDKADAQALLSQRNLEKRMFDTAKSDYLKPANDYLKTSGQYNFVKNEIATGQPTRINRALSQYARIMGQTGVLTDNDIRLQIPPTALAALDRAWTFVSGNPEAELPDNIVKDLLATLDAGHIATKDAYKKKIETVHGMYMMSPYAGMQGLDNLKNQAIKVTESPSLTPSKAEAKQEGISIQDQAKEILRKRKAENGSK